MNRHAVAGFGMAADALAGLGAQVVDLPAERHTLEARADALAGLLPPGSDLLGWSLGGTLALALALHHPGRLRRLALVATTPRFVAGDGPPPGMAPEEFADFRAELARDPARALRRFTALQARGDRRERAVLAALREHLAPADPEALAAGLDCLEHTDLRPRLAEVRVPVLVIAGERDALVPLAACRDLAERLPQGRLAVIEGAGHAPFFSDRASFMREIDGFMTE